MKICSVQILDKHRLISGPKREKEDRNGMFIPALSHPCSADKDKAGGGEGELLHFSRGGEDGNGIKQVKIKKKRRTEKRWEKEQKFGSERAGRSAEEGKTEA